MSIFIVVDDTAGGTPSKSIIGGYTQKIFADAVAFHPYNSLEVIELELDTLNGACLLEEQLGQKPHSRACPIQLHVHGSICSKDCPTCHGEDN